MKSFYFLILCFSLILPSSEDIQKSKKQRRVSFDATVQVYDEQGETQIDMKNYDGKRDKQVEEGLLYSIQYPFVYAKVEVDLSDSDMNSDEEIFFAFSLCRKSSTPSGEVVESRESLSPDSFEAWTAERLKNSLNKCTAVYKKDDKA